MTIHALVCLATLIPWLACGAAVRPVSRPDRPNILFILCDDLGYGDVRCLNPRGKIPTPHIDRLAAQGMVFTDAHSSSSVCTPTRYGILTGRYNWRSRLKSGVLGGTSKPLIEQGRLTVPALLRQHGYHTACIGKWHLGLDWALKDRGTTPADDVEKSGEGWNIEYTQPIRNGPLTVGFDTFFGIAASLDMVPFTFIENDRVTALPTVEKQWIRKGPAAPEFEAVDVLPKLVEKAVAFLGQRAESARRDSPFFLYLPFTSPHTPIVPAPEWQSKSGLNAYADFVMQTDDAVGRVLAALDQHGLTTNTLVFFTSDNGCSPAAQIEELQHQGHEPSHVFRGGKADIFEGGHRIPFIVRWPGRVAAGAQCRELVCLNDLMATCAAVLGARLPDNAGEDSVNLLPALVGNASAPLRDTLVHHSINGSFAIRQGRWKLALCPGSGGWSAPRPGSVAEHALAPVQLYDLEADIGETHNVQSAHPDIVAQLTALLESQVSAGRSTPGVRQTNTTPVNIRLGQKRPANPSNRKGAP